MLLLLSVLFLSLPGPKRVQEEKNQLDPLPVFINMGTELLSYLLQPISRVMGKIIGQDPMTNWSCSKRLGITGGCTRKPGRKSRRMSKLLCPHTLLVHGTLQEVVNISGKFSVCCGTFFIYLLLQNGA